MAEGANAVAAALAGHTVHERFVTPPAEQAPAALVALARERGARISPLTEQAAAGLSETVTPQGIVAVCDVVDRPLEGLLTAAARLVVVLVDVADPGNAGTVIRVADAAGADAVILAGDSVDPHNGKSVRASAGSLFHRPIARGHDTAAVLNACRSAGLRLLAAHGYAETPLDALDPAPPSAWIFGNEAHGLPVDLLRAADTAVRIPIYGDAESLNLATAAAVCLYTSAMAQHRSSGG